MDNQGQTIQQQSKRCRLVLFPLPLQGHINPMIQLANILHHKGFDISIIHTKYNLPNLSEYPHFTVHLIPDGLSETEASTSDIVLLLKLLNEKCVKPFLDCLAQLLSDDADDHIACIITDAIWYFTQAVADNIKIRRIVLRTGSVGSLLAFAALPLFQEKGYLSWKDSEMDAPVVEFPPLKVKDIPSIETCTTEPYQVVLNMVEQTKKASGLIFNTFKELEEPESDKLQEQFLVPTFAIGPFHKYFAASPSSLWTQDRTSLSWLDTQAPKSVIYVSFGSIAEMHEDKLIEVAWGLANSGQPFLWVVRPGLVNGSEWLEILPKEFLEAISRRGYIVKWAPQQEVLSHPSTGGFWTHSGWNSTLESICEGVPMICSPFFGDQKVNSRYVNDIWKVGIKLEKGLDRVQIESAIQKLMVGKEGEDIRKNIMCLKEKLDRCLKPCGSSYQSLENLVDFISSFRPPV
ncbi:UDP-glycosyltransferase 76F1-like [Olea europaea subsp. europaea]|uniref:UDP-glycosyltransferase 76F1-like n=1 Tax=Olea europaea subsp. europaea TaxID=158383 RepID=A0A8S0R606_OLEEU|nr:UDP-glycosyltransferase 76F1-like [Olea europaea subsp. europaea]